MAEGADEMTGSLVLTLGICVHSVALGEDDIWHHLLPLQSGRKIFPSSTRLAHAVVQSKGNKYLTTFIHLKEKNSLSESQSANSELQTTFIEYYIPKM
jgi:hypothetical protein